MRIDFKNVLLCGVIAGLLVGVAQIFTCCCWPVDLAVFLAVGAGVVYLSRRSIEAQQDALVNGAAAGLVSGLLGGFIYAVLTVLTQVAAQWLNLDYSTICGAGVYKPPTLLEASLMGFVCCLPIIVAGVVLGALGALVYFTVTNRSPPAST